MKNCITFITPDFPEFVSGHSGFSAAEVLKGFTGSDTFYDGSGLSSQDIDGDEHLDLVGQFVFFAGPSNYVMGPDQDIVLTWPTFIAAADESGISRLYGGMHIQGRKVFSRAKEL